MTALEGALAPTFIGLNSLAAAVQILTLAFCLKRYQAVKMAVSSWLTLGRASGRWDASRLDQTGLHQNPGPTWWADGGRQGGELTWPVR